MSKSKKSSKVSSKVFSFTPGVSKKEKNKRAKYLSKRINNLFSEISEWIVDIDEYTFKKTSVNVDGEKLPALDIFSGKKSVVKIRPVGLFAFGVNCRLDIVSKKETNVLFDIAKESAKPDWQLISSEAGKKPKKLTKMIFRNLLKTL
jgi:hypothetical protein